MQPRTADRRATRFAVPLPVDGTLSWAVLRDAAAQPLIVDGRRLLDPGAMRTLGFRYEAVGSKDSSPDAISEPVNRPVRNGSPRPTSPG